MSNLVEHAKLEFKAAGYPDMESAEGPELWMQENVLELLETFSKQGHSGNSARYCLDLFETLAKFEPISPLTGSDDEWGEISDGVFQNKRCSRVFKSADEGAYDIEGKVFMEQDGACYVNFESRVPVTFPYTPKTEYVSRFRESVGGGDEVE